MSESSSTRYSEYEIRSSKDGRVYSLAKFSANNQKIAIPDTDTFKSPLFIRFSETESNQKEDGNKEQLSYDERREQGYFRIRRWYHDKDYEWRLYDKAKSETNSYIGTEEASTLNYLVLVPPSDKYGQFKAHQVSNITKFNRNKKYNPLSLDQAEIIIDKKVKFGSSLMKKIMEKQQQNLDVQLKPSTSTKNKKISSFEQDDKEVQKAQDDDVATMAIDRMGPGDASNSFADFENVFEDDEDDSEELNQERQKFEDDRDAEVMNNVDEESEEVADEFEDNDDKADLNVKGTSIEESKEMESSVSNNLPLVEQAIDVNDPKKIERKKFTESLLAKGLKRKLSQEQVPAKKKRVLSDIENKIIRILKSNGGKMKTKELVKSARKESLIADKVQFKNALTTVGALENNKGTKMVVLKAEFSTE